MQERLETSPAGRAAISGLIAVVLLGVTLTHLPASHFKREHDRIMGPFLLATGLDQDWGVFAPDPRRKVIELSGRIVYPGGAVERWHVPDGDPLIGAYWDYRWRKWAEQLILDTHRGLWPGFAAWVARDRRRREPLPTRVELVRRFYDNLPPGRGPDRTPWRSRTFFRLVNAQAGGG